MVEPNVVSEEASYDEMFKDRYTEHDTEYTSRFDAPTGCCAMRLKDGSLAEKMIDRGRGISCIVF